MKRILLKKYLQAYIPQTQSYYSTIIYDGFAGEGLYSDHDGNFSDPSNLDHCGSPLIALQVAIRYFQFINVFPPYVNVAGDSVTLTGTEEELIKTDKHDKATNLSQIDVDALARGKVTLYFVEARNGRYCKLLRNVIKTFKAYDIFLSENVAKVKEGVFSIQSTSKDPGPPPIICHLICSKFECVNCPTINDNERLLAFVDPFGFKIRMAKLANFMGNGKELFFNFMSSYVNRFLKPQAILVGGLFGIDIPSEILKRGKDATGRFLERYVAEHGE